MRLTIILALVIFMAVKACSAHATEPSAIMHTPYPAPLASVPAASDHQPPRFLPAIVAYDKEDRFLAIEVGKTFSYTCKAAVDDAAASIAKATAAGRRLVGLCVPVPTYNPADLVPAADPPKAPADNSL